MNFLFALLAAFSNALNVVTQHVASTSAPSTVKGWRLIRSLLGNPLWLTGAGALVLAFVFQALALHNGLLSAVQTVLMTELVFALVIRRLWLRQTIPPAAWTAAALTCASISTFVIVAEPRGGSELPVSGAWVPSILVCCFAAGLLVLLAVRGSPSRRCGLLATASGAVWGLEATFIKATTDSLTQYGLGGTVLRWPIYAVALGGVAGSLIVQAALHLGPLRVSQPLFVIVDPLVSIALSVHLYGERFTDSVVDLTIASVAFVAMCVGVVLLTRTVPETVERGVAARPAASC